MFNVMPHSIAPLPDTVNSASSAPAAALINFGSYGGAWFSAAGRRGGLAAARTRFRLARRRNSAAERSNNTLSPSNIKVSMYSSCYEDQTTVSLWEDGWHMYMNWLRCTSPWLSVESALSDRWQLQSSNSLFAICSRLRSADLLMALDVFL